MAKVVIALSVFEENRQNLQDRVPETALSKKRKKMEVPSLLLAPAAVVLARFQSDLKSLHPIQQELARDDGQKAGAGGTDDDPRG